MTIDLSTILHRTNMKHQYPATYQAWENMRSRCNNPNDPEYPRYGGRGIVVSKRWDSFARFLSDVGDRPRQPEDWTGDRSYWSLDRIDNDADYDKDNVRWATPSEQASNRRPRTHCPQGHPYEGNNLYVRPDGTGRGCRLCINAAQRRYQARKRANA